MKRCFKITTLSHLELVSWMADGSSSSQSASLLHSGVSNIHAINRWQSLLVQFLSLFHDFLLVFIIALRRSLFLRLVAKIRCSDLHLPTWCRLAQSEIGFIQHLDGEVDALRAKVQDEGIAFKIAIVFGIELYPGLASINFFGNNATA